MKQKLFLSDIDGTLLQTGHPISPRVIAAVRQYVDAGGLFALSTGRPVQAVEQIAALLPVNAPCILSSGTQVYDFSCRKMLLCKTLNPSVFALLQEILQKLPSVSITVYTLEGPRNLRTNALLLQRGVREDREAPPASLAELPDLCKVLFTCEDSTILQKLQQELRTSDDFELHAASTHFYELTPAGVTKGNTADEIWKDTYRIFAAGDAPSDLTLTRSCLSFFAPITAMPTVLHAADRIFPSPIDGGLADVLDYVRLLP